MNSFAVRATAVKNKNEMEKIADIRITLLQLPNTNAFTADNYTCDSGLYLLICDSVQTYVLCFYN